MTVEPGDKSATDKTEAARPAVAPPDRRTGFDSGAPGTAMGMPASPLRWLIVAVPLAVIAVAGSNVLGLWKTEAQRAAQAERQKEAERQAAEAPPPAPTPAPTPAPVLPAPAEPAPDAGAAALPERPHTPKDLWPDAGELLKKFGPPRDKGSDETDTSASDPRADPAPAAEPAVPAAPYSTQVVLSLLPSADLRDGASTFRMCGACHTGDKGAIDKLGPSLWGIVGRPKASRPSFQYSQALKAEGGTWTYQSLARYIHNPKAAVPGTTMSFVGIGDNERLANLIAYLRTFSEAPVPLPK